MNKLEVLEDTGSSLSKEMSSRKQFTTTSLDDVHRSPWIRVDVASLHDSAIHDWIDALVP
jgi:hypothetical protein